MPLIDQPVSDAKFYSGLWQNFFARGGKDWEADAITRVADGRALIQTYAALARAQAASRPETPAARLHRIFAQMRGQSGSMAPRAQPAKNPAKASAPLRDDATAAQPTSALHGVLSAPLPVRGEPRTLAALFAGAGGRVKSLQAATFTPRVTWFARRSAGLLSVARPVGGLAAMRPAATMQARSYAPPATLRGHGPAADEQHPRGDGSDWPMAPSKRGFATADALKLAPRHLSQATPAERGFAGPNDPAAANLHQADLYQALEELFYRESRLAPSSGSAFDPLLTPAWAGLGLGS